MLDVFLRFMRDLPSCCYHSIVFNAGIRSRFRSPYAAYFWDTRLPESHPCSFSLVTSRCPCLLQVTYCGLVAYYRLWGSISSSERLHCLIFLIRFSEPVLIEFRVRFTENSWTEKGHASQIEMVPKRIIQLHGAYPSIAQCCQCIESIKIVFRR